jgi:hypothetical protein
MDMRSADLFTRIIGRMKYHRGQQMRTVDETAEGDQEQARLRAVLLSVEIDLNDPTTADVALKLTTALLEERQRSEQMFLEQHAPEELAKPMSLIHMAMSTQNVAELVIDQYGLGVPAECSFCDD